jgi:hypothetical protein
MAAAWKTRIEKTVGDLAGLVAALEKSDVPYLVMDDARSALSLYPDRALRPIQSIGLLIRENNWDAVIRLCEEQGFERDIRDPDFEKGVEALEYYQYFSPCRLRNEHGTELLLAFRLFDLGKPEAEEAAWMSATRVECEAITFTGIGLEDHLLRMCMRLNMTRFERPLFAVDAGLLLAQRGGEIDWAYVDSRARSRSAYPAVYCAGHWVRDALLCGGAFRMSPPPGRLRRRLFETIWRPGRSGLLEGKRIRLHRFRFYFLECGTIPEKLNLVVKIITPRKQWVSAFFGAPYKPWLKLKFIALTFRERLGMPLSRGEDLHYQ